MISYSVTALYSGSKGNSVLIESNNTKILIDAGKSARALCSALSGIERDADGIDAIFITHEHTDHIGALENLLKKHPIPVHVAEASARAMISRKPNIRTDCIVSHSPIFSVEIGNMRIESFPTPHDSECSVGYRIEISEGDESVCVGYATDIGYVTEDICRGLLGCKSVVLEANHDENMLMNGPYPYDLKLRIRSKHGHLSNTECSALAARLCETGTENILLAHLSEENNDPTLALSEVRGAVGNDGVNIRVASQYESVRLV